MPYTAAETSVRTIDIGQPTLVGSKRGLLIKAHAEARKPKKETDAAGI